MLVLGAVAAADQRAVAELAPAVEREQRRERKRQPRRQLAVVRARVVEHGAQDARLVLADRVERDAGEVVLDERVREPFAHAARERRDIRARQRQRRQDLLLDAALHVAADQRVVHALAHGLLAGQVGGQHGHRVRAVEDADLALAVRRHVRRPRHVQAGLGERQLAVQRARRFDDPRMEHLAGDQQLVVVAELRRQLRRLVLRVTGDDAVDQRVGEHARLAQPAREAVSQPPALRGLADRARQRVAVALDELTRQHHQPLVGRAAGGGEASVQELGQLARERRRRARVERVGRIGADPRLGRVRHDEAQVRIRRAGDERAPVLVRIHAAADRRHDLARLDDAPVRQAAQDDRVQTVLVVHLARHARRDRLHQHDAPAEQAARVQPPDHPIDEPAQEVPLAELQHLLGQRLHLRHRELRRKHMPRRQQLGVETGLGRIHSVTPSFQIAISRKPLRSFFVCARPLATSSTSE